MLMTIIHQAREEIPGGGEDGQIDVQSAQAVEEIQGLGLVSPVMCHPLQLLPDGQNLILAGHSGLQTNKVRNVDM